MGLISILKWRKRRRRRCDASCYLDTEEREEETVCRSVATSVVGKGGELDLLKMNYTFSGIVMVDLLQLNCTDMSSLN